MRVSHALIFSQLREKKGAAFALLPPFSAPNLKLIGRQYATTTEEEGNFLTATFFLRSREGKGGAVRVARRMRYQPSHE